MSSGVSMGGADRPSNGVGAEKIGSMKPAVETYTPSVRHPENGLELKQAQVRGDHIPISETQLVKAIEKAIKAMQGPNTELTFSIHEKTKQIMVKVKNVESGEIIREIPTEKSMDLLAKLWEMAGIMVDERW